MISTSHKFILITPPKTGSVSLVKSLLPYINISKIKDQGKDCFDFIDDFNPTLSKHTSLNGYESKWRMEIYGSADQYKIYGSIRNPYEIQLSWYFWMKKRWPSNVPSTFDKFIDERKENLITISNFFKSRHTLVLKYIRFERLQESFDQMCEELNIPQQQLPHKNSTNHRHYTEYYDDKTREIVTKCCEEDIERFEYSFGD